MSEISLREAFECLDVPPEAGLAKVRRAYLELKGIYADDALASYGLFDPEARKSRLERIETAYRLVLRKLTEGPGGVVALHQRPQRAPVVGEKRDLPPVDPEQSPGLFLQRARERAGISLQEIARHTKVGMAKLTNIETEKFHLLPAPVYLRGFVEQYARLIGLPEPRQVAESYLARCDRTQEED